MRWNLHGTIIEGTSNDATVNALWQRSFASLPGSAAKADIRLQLTVVDNVPQPPQQEAQFRQGELLAYYVCEPLVVAHFPRYGSLRLDLENGSTEGQIVSASVQTYGVLEDLIAIGLSAHLRRKGAYLLHAFAAAHGDRAVLLVGGIGAGKTTTGLSLLSDGWKLLSNDSPLIASNGFVLSYPGVLSAYPETFNYFEATRHVGSMRSPTSGRGKLSVDAEQIWPDVWLSQAPIGAILFPQIRGHGTHELAPIPPAETLRRLLPHAVERWDRAMVGPHLEVLGQLVEAAPGYRLFMGPEVVSLPRVIASSLMMKG